MDLLAYRTSQPTPLIIHAHDRHGPFVGEVIAWEHSGDLSANPIVRFPGETFGMLFKVADLADVTYSAGDTNR